MMVDPSSFTCTIITDREGRNHLHNVAAETSYIRNYFFNHKQNSAELPSPAKGIQGAPEER
jgi:hypothetical protein